MLLLKPDGTTNPKSAVYPITWKGWLWPYQIEVVQYTMDIDNFDHFEFKQYPAKLKPMKKKVWRAIKKSLDTTA